MRTLFIGSTVGNSGKTMITIGWRRRSRRAATRSASSSRWASSRPWSGARWWMPTRSFSRRHSTWPNAGADLSRLVTQDLFFRALHGDAGDVPSRIQKAFDAVSAGKDVVLMGGAGTLADGGFLGVPTLKLVKDYKAPVLLVDPYHNESASIAS